MSDAASSATTKSRFPDLSPSPPPPNPNPTSDQPTSFVPVHAAPPPVTNLRGTIDHNKLVNRTKRLEFEKLQQESVMACDEQIKAFAMCATGRTFSTVWACRTHNDEMHKCMSN